MLPLLASVAVAPTGGCSSAAPSTAKLFTSEDFGSYRIVNSTQCGETYVLYPRERPQPNLGPGLKYFAVPLTKVAVTQTVTNTFMEMLGVLDKVSVASPYTTSACIAKRVSDGIAESFISHSSDPEAHALQVGNSEIDAIFSDPWGTSNWKHTASASKIVCEASTYEQAPLANAEWIKFLGYLFGKETEANEAFCQTESRYLCNSLSASSMTSLSPHTQLVLFSSVSWNGDFSLQVPPYKDEFIRSAGAVMPDLSAFEQFKKMHWTGTQLSSYSFSPAHVDQFHQAIRLADVLIDETYPHGQTLQTIASAYKLPDLAIGKTFLAASDDPAQGNAGWSLTSHGVGEKLFTINDAGNLVGSLGFSVTRSSSDDWLLTLNPNRHFADGTTVTATDVAIALSRTNERNSAAQSSVGKMTLTVTGELTLTIRTTIDTPVMKSVLAEWPFVIYKTAANGERVFTGPYAISNHTSTMLHLIPNVHYPNAEQRIPITIKRYGSGDALTAALRLGEIDLGFNLPASSVAQLNWQESVNVKSFAVGYQYMMFFNTNRTALADVKVRQALALAIDRRALAQSVLPEGVPDSTLSAAIATGAFPSSTPWGAAHAPLPTNSSAAARLLDEAGWVLGGDGLRAKAGTKLTVQLVYYTFRSDFVIMAPLIKAQLEALGVVVSTRVNDVGDFTNAAGFDLLLWAQHTLPAGDPNWFLETFFRTGPVLDGNWQAQNFARHSSAAIDSALDQLASSSGDARAAAAATAHKLILDETPATFLISPIWHVGVGRRVSSYEPWGSDYHVVRNEMPPSDWPRAILNARVYTLDGTMDSRGPPFGGTDWYESRVAQPDGFLADLISVIHPNNADHVPSGMQYLRHAATGVSKQVSSSQCGVETTQTHAPTCAELASKSTDLRLVESLNNLIVRSPSSQVEEMHADNTVSYVLIGILAGCLVLLSGVSLKMYLQMSKTVKGQSSTKDIVDAKSNTA